MKSLFLLFAFTLITTHSSLVLAEEDSSKVGKASDSSAGAAKLCDTERKAVQPGGGKGKAKEPVIETTNK